ncbi:DUF2975 domain-containing protein [Saccharopolyspora indica]|uniref:DUF2975 domain-containing protein n=1 Tax=Saccharopolyspora indica TaxID=1229659 RepID=UPI0022EAB413|nr:DUF2975 domain-containing protein [Saccharopolyspora indica]MDA3647384.1 DUF2975 domain-containing protein [Saccharopolyspora indica]
MGNAAVLVLRVVLTIGLAGSLFVQAVMVPMAILTPDEFPSAVRIPVLVLVLLGIATVQVTMICVWRLLTMVRRGTVFSPAAFRYVDIVIGAVAAASILTFALGGALAPGEAVAPGIVLLIGGAGVLIAGVALLVLVMRTLLAQAIARETEARHLQDELDEVI